MKFNTKEVKKLMVDKDIPTIKELAKLCEVSEPTIGQALRKKRIPTVGTLEKMAGVLGVPYEKIGEIFFTD